MESFSLSLVSLSLNLCSLNRRRRFAIEGEEVRLRSLKLKKQGKRTTFLWKKSRLKEKEPLMIRRKEREEVSKSVSEVSVSRSGKGLPEKTQKMFPETGLLVMVMDKTCLKFLFRLKQNEGREEERRRSNNFYQTRFQFICKKPSLGCLLPLNRKEKRLLFPNLVFPLLLTSY